MEPPSVYPADGTHTLDAEVMKMGLFRDLVRARELELAYVMRWRLPNRERQERP